MPRSNTPAKSPDSALDVKRAELVAAFVQLVNRVPDAPDGDITDLLGPILAAQDWEELNQSDKLPSSKTMIGHDIRVNTIAKKVSDKNSLTGYYLLCEGIDFATGYVGRFTVGGAQAVAVLSQLHVLGKLPAKVRFDEVPNEKGEGPAINCRVLDIYENAVIDA